MMKINLICVGKLGEKHWRDAMTEYEKRLTTLCDFKVIEIAEEKSGADPSDAEIKNILKKEGERIAAKIPSGSKVISMCIEGEQTASPDLGKKLAALATSGTSCVCFIIGGSWGLDESIKRLGERMSMSKMTFPHQLARVMMTEQIYRAFMINAGAKYHK